jgi:hypothetical protein
MPKVMPACSAWPLPEVHPMFAAGEAIFRGDFCQLWACSFYTPGILEIIESLLGAGNASPQVRPHHSCHH